MESAAVLCSFHYAVSTSCHLRTMLDKPGVLTMNKATFYNLSNLPVCGGKIISSKRHGSISVSCVKTSETTLTSKSNGDPNGAVLSDSQEHGSMEKKSSPRATFPNGFEALLTEVCDETKIAELKLKFGDFELHMKRKVDSPIIPAPFVPQTAAPPVPSKPTNESTSSAPPPQPKSSAEKVSPFTNVSAEKAAKLAALEASGSNGYVIVSSPTVGSFRRARTLKGKKQPPACKEGDVIKEGQTIGFLDQFGTELPVKSDVEGEVLKLLYSDGEAVGYGDPLIAVLPSFHGIQ
ncbi:hypothetical protein BUALT_Bualt01G0053600 [Buddleja alternifolia]|uniref:Lipoyl-binding domain-containing protein n=1 Tax=Buddleja alternifolia TaxID=168488 RepID=A0AAV6YFK0_9LAMI|nr:hypothetical protein BUALT_Bualt01G0053600 [Buddleja alternifolia]